nr:MAG TPA_asm: hypothetical protein [Caudoviricetes sp.]
MNFNRCNKCVTWIKRMVEPFLALIYIYVTQFIKYIYYI